MSIPYKERIFGAVVLVSLVVIFIPMLFDSDLEQESQIVSAIPDAPAWAEEAVQFTVPHELRTAKSPTVGHPDTSFIKEEVDEQEISTVVMPTLDLVSEKLQLQESVAAPTLQIPTLEQPAAYSVQLGTFSKKENADQLVTELRSKGYEAYLRQSFGRSDLMRVLVGPRIQKSDAEQLQQQLATEFQLQGLVLPFEPSEG